MGFGIPRSAYHGLACIKCGEQSSSWKRLFKCSRCSRVSYCDVNCQKDDYRDHKRFCRAWVAIRAEDSPVAKLRNISREDFEALVEKRTKWILGQLERLIGEPLTHVEKRLVIFEPRCTVCFRTAHDLQQNPDYPGQQLLCCSECFSIYTCSEEHKDMIQESHAGMPYEPGGPVTRCKMHRLVVLDDEENNEYCRYETKPIWFPARRLGKCITLTAFSRGNAWVDWFSLPETQWPKDYIGLLDMRSASAPLSFPMTTLYGMELFDDPRCRTLVEKTPGSSALSVVPDPFRSRPYLEIHIVGIRANELVTRQALIFEELHHLLPTCKQLVLRFVGPDLVGYPSLYAEVPLDFDDVTLGCIECRASGMIRVQSMHSCTYHEWLRERRRNNDSGTPWAMPDLIVCFNAAMTENPSNTERWAPTLSFLLDMGVPTLVSAFTEKDAKSDRNFVRDFGGLITIEPCKNPWRNEQGLPEFSGNDEFYFFNNYIFGFCGRAMKQAF